jgi:translation initiation factor 5B
MVLARLFTAGILSGFDASGHVAEETKHARSVWTFVVLVGPNILDVDSVVASRGIISGAIATGVLGFIATILFLFCIPDLNTFFALNAPQPFVQVYALALGKGPSVFMTIIAVIGLVMVRVAVSYHSHVTHFPPSEHHRHHSGLFAARLCHRA